MNSFGHHGMVKCCVYHLPVHGREGVARALNTTQGKNYKLRSLTYNEWSTIKGRTESETKRLVADLTASWLLPFSRPLQTTNKTATIFLKKIVRKTLLSEKLLQVWKKVVACMESNRIFSSSVWAFRGTLWKTNGKRISPRFFTDFVVHHTLWNYTHPLKIYRSFCCSLLTNIITTRQQWMLGTKGIYFRLNRTSDSDKIHQTLENKSTLGRTY